MNESHVSKQVPYPGETGEDEISLVDIIKFLWKWKILIIAGMGISVGIAALINETNTPVYQVEMMIRPLSTGKQVSIESPENIKFLVESKGVADLENKNQIKGVEILQYPAAGSRPVKPNKVLNIVLSVFVGGLLTLIIAGTVEFVQKYKSEIVASQ